MEPKKDDFKDIPWLFRPMGDGKPWPYDKRLRIGGKVMLGFALCLLLLGALYFSIEITQQDVELYQVIVFASLLTQGILYIPVGIAAIRVASTKAPGWRKVLKVFGVILLVCSVVFCILILNIKRDFISFGMFGIVFAPGMLILEKKVI